MSKKKNIISGFAVFVALLMLAMPCIARPIQESATMDAVVRELINDDVEDDCSLCADDISSDLFVIQQELEFLQENGLIPDELSAEALEIQEMISDPSPTVDCDSLIELVLFFLVLSTFVKTVSVHIITQGLYKLYLENCA